MKLKITVIVISAFAISITAYSVVLNNTVTELRVELNERNSEVGDLENRIAVLEHENRKALLQNEDLQEELNTSKRLNSVHSNGLIKSEGVKYRATEPLEIRSEMTDGSAVIGDVPAGGIVEVINSFFGSKWEIRYKGIKGWIKTEKWVQYYPDGRKEGEVQLSQSELKPTLERIK